ncbi:MAG: hypothetical protein RSB67_02215 [Clostridia bacterium]
MFDEIKKLVSDNKVESAKIVFERTIYELIRKMDSVLHYMDENPLSDVNVFELNQLLFEEADLANKGRIFEYTAYGFLNDPLYKELNDKFNELYFRRIKDLSTLSYPLYNVDKKTDTLYRYFEAASYRKATLISLGDNETMQVTNSICGVNLYIKQRKRDLYNEKKFNEVIYDNLDEFNWLTKSIEMGYISNLLVNETKAMFDEIKEAFGKTLNDFK